MSSDNRGPLHKKLIAFFSLVGAKIVVQVAVLKTQPVKLADVPGHIRGIAERPLPWVINDGSVIEEKSGGPIPIYF
jgi:hypothetical protein